MLNYDKYEINMKTVTNDISNVAINFWGKPFTNFHVNIWNLQR